MIGHTFNSHGAKCGATGKSVSLFFQFPQINRTATSVSRCPFFPAIERKLKWGAGAAGHRGPMIIGAARAVLMQRVGALHVVTRRMCAGGMLRGALVGLGRACRVMIHLAELRDAAALVARVGGALGGVEVLLRGAGIGSWTQLIDKALRIGDLRAGDLRRRGMGEGRTREQERGSRGGNGDGNHAHEIIVSLREFMAGLKQCHATPCGCWFHGRIAV